MSIQLASSDETIIETIAGAYSIHRDSNKIIVIFNADSLTDDQEALLVTDGLYVGFNIEDEMIKTKSQIILTPKSKGGSVEWLKDNDFIVEFEL